MSCGLFWIVRPCCRRQTYDTPIGIYVIVLWKSNPQLAIALPKEVCPNTNYCADAMKLKCLKLNPKGLITWRISARAEISVHPPG